MGIDATTQAQIDANNAEIQSKMNELQQQMTQFASKEKAQAESGIYMQLGLSKFGQAADNELGFLQQFQQITDKRAEAEAAGVPPPPSDSGDLALVYGSQQNNKWDVIANGFGNTKDKGNQGP